MALHHRTQQSADLDYCDDALALLCTGRTHPAGSILSFSSREKSSCDMPRPVLRLHEAVFSQRVICQNNSNTIIVDTLVREYTHAARCQPTLSAVLLHAPVAVHLTLHSCRIVSQCIIPPCRMNHRMLATFLHPLSRCTHGEPEENKLKGECHCKAGCRMDPILALCCLVTCGPRKSPLNQFLVARESSYSFRSTIADDLMCCPPQPCCLSAVSRGHAVPAHAR